MAGTTADSVEHIRSVEEHAEDDGQTLRTSAPAVIRRWAQARAARPATGTPSDLLRLDRSGPEAAERVARRPTARPPHGDGHEWLFAYGSLVAARPHGAAATLAGLRRRWGVAMDNRRDLPGYKWYRLPDGRRPAAFVAFLDLRPATGGAVNGRCLPVDAAALRRLDARERNYVRVDVTARIPAAPPGRVWAYVGSAAGRARLRHAVAGGRALIDRGYLIAVARAFDRLGAAELAAFHASTDAPPAGCAVAPLERVDLR